MNPISSFSPWLRRPGFRRSRPILPIVGGGLAIAVLAAGVWAGHRAIKRAIAAKTTQPQCYSLNVLSSSATTCYPQPTRLTTEPTTAIVTDAAGSLLITSHDRRIHVWDLTTGTRLRSLIAHRHWVSALALAPDRRTLASASLDGTIHLWDVATGRLEAILMARQTTALAFSPDGRLLASGTRLVDRGNPTRFRPIRLWDVATGEWISSLPVEEPITAIAFSPDGQKVAGGSRQVRVWDLSTERSLYSVEAGDLNALSFSPDSQWLLTGGDGIQGKGGIKFWRATTGERLRSLHSIAGTLAISPDGSRLLTTYGDSVHLWQFPSLRYLGTLPSATYSSVTAQFGDAGQAIVVGSSEGVQVWRSPISE